MQGTAGPWTWDTGAWHGWERMRKQPSVGRAFLSHCAVNGLVTGKCCKSQAGVWKGESRW